MYSLEFSGEWSNGSFRTKAEENVFIRLHFPPSPFSSPPHTSQINSGIRFNFCNVD